MKTKLYLFFMISFLILGACSQPENITQNEPFNTTIELIKSISPSQLWPESKELTEANYQKFLGTFGNDYKNNASFEKYEQLKDAATDTVVSGLFEILIYNNGEMFLVYYDSSVVNGEYKIYDVIMIPEEVKDFFNNIINY